MQVHRGLVAQQVKPHRVVLGRQVCPDIVWRPHSVETTFLFPEPVSEVDLAAILVDRPGSDQLVRQHNQPVSAKLAEAADVRCSSK